MFISLSKILPLLIYPLGLASLCLLLALWLWPRRRWQAGVILTAFALLWVGGSPFAMTALLKPLEWEFLPPTEPAALQAEMIVVLGGSTRAQIYPRPIPELNDTGSRMLYAAALYRQGAAPRLLLTGGNLPWANPSVKTEAETMAAVLEIMGVPREALILEGQSRNTYENAVNTRAILEDEGIDQIILITSAMHMPRSYRIFTKQGFDVIPAPADFNITYDEAAVGRPFDLTAFILRLLPTAENLNLTSRALKEYMGLAVYRLRGWL